MIRKKWRDGEPVLSVETEDEFWKAVSTGEAVELTRELADQLGLMEEGTQQKQPQNPRIAFAPEQAFRPVNTARNPNPPFPS